MSSPDLARRVKVGVTIDGTDVTKDVGPYLLSLTYTDNEEDGADDLKLELQDRDGRWLSSLLGGALEGAAEVSGGGDIYTVNAKSGLTVRSGPGTGYSKAGVKSCGSEVAVRGWENGWAIIDGGYLYGGFLTKKEAGSGNSGTPGTRIEAVITRLDGDRGDQVLDCGEFELDSVGYNEPPSTVSIKATALPYSRPIRQTEKTAAWEAYTLSRIVSQIAAANGMTAMYESAIDPYYERVEQYKESDISFLSALCHNAGLSLKVTRRVLVVFDQAGYEAKPAVMKIRRRDGSYIKASLKAGTADTKYESCRVRYSDPMTGECVEGTAYSEDYVKPKEGQGQCLEITAKVASAGEAEALASKLLRLHNKFARTASFTMPLDGRLAAGVTVELEDFGAWDGRYILRQAVHSLTPSGCTTTAALRRCLEGY